MTYDYLIVGAGLFGAVFAQRAAAAGKRCLVLEKRRHVAGNVYTERVDGITLHHYGAHIFHTSDAAVWAFVNATCSMRPYVNSPMASAKGRLFNLPFNMNTFYALWQVKTPAEAKAKIEAERQAYAVNKPSNLEEQAVSLVGRELFETLIKGYTEKQWGRACNELPAAIIKRIPLRFTFDNNYFNDRWQGIPEDGYTAWVEALLQDADVRLGVDYLADKSYWDSMAERVIYTGPVDAYFGFSLGELEYRSLRFETNRFEEEDRQGVAVVNHCDASVPYTRTIEHKHFLKEASDVTYVTREYPASWSRGLEPYYPINDTRNTELYARYEALTRQECNVVFGGRLGTYRYLDMDRVIASALETAAREGL